MNHTAGACRELAIGLAEVLRPPSLHCGGTDMAPAPRVMATLSCSRPRAARLQFSGSRPEYG